MMSPTEIRWWRRALKVVRQAGRSLAWLFRLYVLREPIAVHTQRWHAGRYDDTLRLEYPLNENSLVVDGGGYHGEWSQQIVERYDPEVIVIEPIAAHVDLLRRRFDGNAKVTVLHAALGGRAGTVTIAVDADGSSETRTSPKSKSETARLIDVADVLDDLRGKDIDLLKLNIEGGEYDVLQRLLDAGLIRRVIDIQVQFHIFVANSAERRERIRAQLRSSHELTYDFPFVWENWRRKASSGGAGD